MKERPILFSAPMVRAILDGSKTQTRRVIKPQPISALPSTPTPIDEVKKSLNQMIKSGRPYIATEGKATGLALPGSPYGKSGDRLWVRETFLVDDNRRITGTRKNYEVDYRATSEDSPHWRWRPSIHMPRWASRITLEVTGVRVERLQDITNNDALDEGTPDLRTKENNWDMVRCYQELWGHINGNGSWSLNPWVWVIEFKRVEK